MRAWQRKSVAIREVQDSIWRLLGDLPARRAKLIAELPGRRAKLMAEVLRARRETIAEYYAQES